MQPTLQAQGSDFDAGSGNQAYDVNQSTSGPRQTAKSSTNTSGGGNDVTVHNSGNPVPESKLSAQSLQVDVKDVTVHS